MDSAQSLSPMEQVQTLYEQSQRTETLQQLVSLVTRHQDLSRLPEIRDIAHKTPVAKLTGLLRVKGLLTARLQPTLVAEKTVVYREEEEEPTDVTYQAFEED